VQVPFADTGPMALNEKGCHLGSGLLDRQSKFDIDVPHVGLGAKACCATLPRDTLQI
jgi:hypothetical protein